MSLQLSLQAPTRPFLAQSSMPVAVMLTNLGSAAARLPAFDSPVPFEFTVHSADGLEVLQVASAQKQAVAKSRGLVLQPVPETEPIDPGGAEVYQVDLAGMLVSPLAPGRYQLTVSLRWEGSYLQSSPAPFDVVPVVPAALTQCVDGLQKHLMSVVFHREKDSGLLLLKWESATDHPQFGSFRNLHVLSDTPIESSSLALDVEEDDSPDGRWLCWLQAGMVFGGLLRTVDLKYPFPPLAVEMKSPRLLENGYQFEQGSALFVLIGEVGTERRLRLLAIPEEESPALKNVTLTMPPGTDPWVSLRHTKDGHELLICWLSQADGVTRLMSAAVDPEVGSTIRQEESCFETDREVATAALEPLAPARVQMVLVPSKPGNPYTLVVLDLDAPDAVREVDLPPMEALEDRAAGRWLLPSLAAASGLVGRLIDDELWVTGKTPGSGWERIDALDTGAESVRLWVFPGERLWLSFFRPGSGLSYIELH